ncbi:hypothetical protein AB0C02_30815 [Micromonospora sp. NPDC048999]|uniref:hypothetical protein n=1 Tax=Micromonospora sp. NPDC048999 TaxID=3155391 RepID=UPI0034077170
MSRKLPIDQGYAAITALPGGGKRVEVYASLSTNGPTKLFAAHSFVPNVLVLSKAAFERRGQTSFSTDVVEVLQDPDKNQLIIRDPS